MVTEAMSEAPVVTTKRVIAESVSADESAILWYVHESAFIAGTFRVSRAVEPSPSLTRIPDEVVVMFDFIQNSRCVYPRASMVANESVATTAAEDTAAAMLMR